MRWAWFNSMRKKERWNVHNKTDEETNKVRRNWGIIVVAVNHCDQSDATASGHTTTSLLFYIVAFAGVQRYHHSLPLFSFLLSLVSSKIRPKELC
jgi:hypothetical protein